MKRHKICGSINEITKLSECMMIEDPDGEWVKWEDVKNKFFNCDDCIFVPETCTEKCPGREGIQLKDKSLKCNCEEMFLERIYWFCPAHGYKRR